MRDKLKGKANYDKHDLIQSIILAVANTPTINNEDAHQKKTLSLKQIFEFLFSYYCFKWVLCQ